MMGALVFPTSAGADDDEEEPTYPVCHVNKQGTRYKLLYVEEIDVGEHLGHGDGQPGDPVPGMEDYNFSADCVPVDVTPPVVTVPDDLVVEATAPEGAVVDFTATATDAVDGPLDVTCIPSSGSTFSVGDTVVQCSATDAAGNTGTASFTVTVEAPGFLVRAISTDAGGNTRVIAELLDTNGDGVPSVGDTVKLYQYPTAFDGINYSPFWITECVLDGFVIVDNQPNYRLVFGGSSSDPNCYFDVWYDEYGAYEQFYAEYYDGSTFSSVNLLDGEGVGIDWILDTSGLNQQRADTTDDRWLDIEFDFTPTP